MRLIARIMRRAVELPQRPRRERLREGEPFEFPVEPDEAQPPMA